MDIKISKITVLLISFATIGFLESFHWEQMYNAQLIQANYEVIERTPPWRVNQSRLMGPAILKILTLIGFSKWWALRLFATVFVIFNNFLYVKSISLFTDSKYQIINSLLIFNSLFIISQDTWLYVWDFLDISFFIFYGLVIFKNKYMKYLVLVNFLHIFNRESALIMCVFFIYVLFINKNKNIENLIKDKLFLGLSFNFIFGLVYTYFARTLLFIEQSTLIGGGGGQDLGNNFLGGNWVTPSLNLYYILNGEVVANILILGSLLTVLLFIIKKYKSFNFSEKFFSIATIINIIPIFIFGIYVETRQLFPSIVMICFLLFSLSIKNQKI